MRTRSSELKKPSFLTRILARGVDYCLLYALGILVSLVLPVEVSNLFLHSLCTHCACTFLCR